MIQYRPSNQTLKNIVKEYYFVTLSNDDEQKEITIIDDCCHDIVFYKQSNAELVYGEKAKTKKIKTSLFTILDLQPPYKLRFKDELSFFTIKFQPWMNAFFLGYLKETGIVDLKDIYPELHQISKQLNDGIEFNKVVKHLNHYFLKQTIVLSPKMILVKSICEFVYEKKGFVKIKEISQHFNKTRQYITKVFRELVMCNLKTFVTAVRIVDLVKYKSKQNNLPLTELSYEYGYFDQAHFINDFKKICGVTPRQYFKDLPDFILRHD